MAIFVVQSESGGAQAASLTVTLGAPVTAGNTICASVAVFDGATSSFTVALTLGSSPDNWFLNRHYTRTSGGSTSYASVWSDANCAGGSDTVTITLTGATGSFFTGISAQVWEVSGLAGAVQDTTAAGGSNSPSWDAGAFSPPTTTAADEFWFGCLSTPGAATITGPASPWTNTSVASGQGSVMLSGFQITTAKGSPSWSGTFSTNSQYAAVGVTLKGGIASGTAALAGHGTLAAAAGPGAGASATGTGTLAATGASAAPDSAPMAGAGRLAAAGTFSVAGQAALSGTGTLAAEGSPPTVITVVNQWAGTLAQNPVFGPSLPAISDVVVSLTLADSVGGGSGIPTAGNWLFAVAGWRQSPGGNPVTINVADDSHGGYWRPTAPSTGTGITRTAIWYQPNIGQVTITPGWVYVATNGYVAGMSVLVVEVSGIGTWDEVAGVAVNYSPSTQSLSLTVPL